MYIHLLILFKMFWERLKENQCWNKYFTMLSHLNYCYLSIWNWMHSHLFIGSLFQAIYTFVQVTWKFQNKEITDGDHYTIQYSHGICTLEITRTKVDDSGKYTCIAENPLGEQETSCKVEVEGEKLYYVLY